jgi:6-pyruvoyl-tetrahydropterin synthase
MSHPESFRVQVTKDYLKFSAAHFIAYQGFREALHGHNYRVAIAAEGPLSAQGYVVDFAIVKRIARRLCADLDERMLLPEESDCLVIENQGHVVRVRYENDEFAFPASDVKLLPIVHSSVEEIARYLAGCLRAELAREGVQTLRAVEVTVEESFGQSAIFRQEL